jgi:hypothetical protein
MQPKYSPGAQKKNGFHFFSFLISLFLFAFFSDLFFSLFSLLFLFSGTWVYT